MRWEQDLGMNKMKYLFDRLLLFNFVILYGKSYGGPSYGAFGTGAGYAGWIKKSQPEYYNSNNINEYAASTAATNAMMYKRMDGDENNGDALRTKQIGAGSSSTKQMLPTAVANSASIATA